MMDTDKVEYFHSAPHIMLCGLEQKKKEFLLLPYFPKGGGLINVAWLSGSAECVYSVVAGMC